MKFRHEEVIFRDRSNGINLSLEPIKQPGHSKYAFWRPSILTWNTLVLWPIFNALKAVYYRDL